LGALCRILRTTHVEGEPFKKKKKKKNSTHGERENPSKKKKKTTTTTTQLTEREKTLFLKKKKKQLNSWRGRKPLKKTTQLTNREKTLKKKKKKNLQNHKATPTRQDVSQDTKESTSNKVQNLTKGKVQFFFISIQVKGYNQSCKDIDKAHYKDYVKLQKKATTTSKHTQFAWQNRYLYMTRLRPMDTRYTISLYTNTTRLSKRVIGSNKIMTRK
jgi:hypothetical protein